MTPAKMIRARDRVNGRGMRALWLGLALMVVGCHSPGVYGYSVDYAPLDEEEDALEEATDYDPVMAERDPKTWKERKVSTFGVVVHRGPARGKFTPLTLSVRSLSTRNLCEEEGEHTCRVTVSERGHGTVEALVQLGTEDDIGKLRVTPKSLVRVVGRLDYSKGPAPVLHADYYRHWPRNEYVTTEARSYMTR
jgi:hypothetical protein